MRTIYSKMIGLFLLLVGMSMACSSCSSEDEMDEMAAPCSGGWRTDRVVAR